MRLQGVNKNGDKGEPKSFRAYQNLSSSGVAVDAVLFFPAGTLAFGHAAGWANATESDYANTHAWAGGGEDPLRPPRCRQPGVLRRHAVQVRLARILEQGAARRVDGVFAEEGLAGVEVVVGHPCAQTAQHVRGPCTERRQANVGCCAQSQRFSKYPPAEPVRRSCPHTVCSIPAHAQGLLQPQHS